jgi:hypothetical protein
MLLGCGSAAKNRQSEYGEHNTDQRSRHGQTKRKRSSRLAGSICVVMVRCCLHGTEPAPEASSITHNSNRGAVWLRLHAMYFKHSEIGISERLKFFLHAILPGLVCEQYHATHETLELAERESPFA